MSDFTHCRGEGCLLAFRCRRFTDKPSENQYYFTDAPFKVIENTLHCDMFYGETQDSIIEQLNEITDGKANEGRNKETEFRGVEKDEPGT